MTSPFHRLLLPLGPDIDQDRVLLPAMVLASWFDATIQIVCGDPEKLASYQDLARGLGTPIEPVVQLEGLTIDGLVAHANSNEHTLIVAEGSEFGLELACRSSRPVFLVAGRPEDGASHRLPLGPLALEVTGSQSDLDALALAAVVAPALEESIRLVVELDRCDSSLADTALGQYATDAEERLAVMGLEVAVDALRANGLKPLVLVGRTRGCTAVLVPRSRLVEPGLVDEAMARGVNVMVAATPEAGTGRPAPFAVDLSRPATRAPTGADLSELDQAECRSRLGRHSVARIGYVNAGWPTVVPVNYRYDDPNIFISSLVGGKLAAAEREDVVCLEIDGYDELLRTGWSVVVHGRLEVIDDAATLRQAWDGDPASWVRSDRWQWLRLVPLSITGRTVEPGH